MVAVALFVVCAVEVGSIWSVSGLSCWSVLVGFGAPEGSRDC